MSSNDWICFLTAENFPAILNFLNLYAWNSCPIWGMDLSHSLLTMRQEFHFPVSFEANWQVSYDIMHTDKKLFAENLRDLLPNSQEVYPLLMAEHQAAHQECWKAQINNPREFKLEDIIFSNMQVQRKNPQECFRSWHTLKRGSCKIIKDYKSGSYELQPTAGWSQATIKNMNPPCISAPNHLYLISQLNHLSWTPETHIRRPYHSHTTWLA